MKRNVLVYGLGLMGASLCMSLKKKSPESHLIGVVRNTKSKTAGDKLGIVDQILLEPEFLAAPNWETFDLIILSLPVDTTIQKLKLIPSDLQCLITDLGSTKQTIVDAAEKHFLDGNLFVSSHPMCGSEEAGLENAIPDLYEEKLCFLTALGNAAPDALTQISDFWKEIGMHTMAISAREHDYILAHISHLPHVISSALAIATADCESVKGITDKSQIPLYGGSFKDMVRVAGSNPEMWSAIFRENRKEILESLLGFRDVLDEAIERLENPKENDRQYWTEFMDKAKVAKNLLEKKSTDA